MARIASRHLSLLRPSQSYPSTSKLTPSLWNRIVTPCFYGCLFLFLRAIFGFGPHGAHLDPLATTGSRVHKMASALVLGSDHTLGVLPARKGVQLAAPNWNPVGSMDVTQILGLPRMRKRGDENHDLEATPTMSFENAPYGLEVSDLASPHPLDLTSAQRVGINAIPPDHDIIDNNDKLDQTTPVGDLPVVDRDYDPLYMNLLFAIGELNDGIGRNIPLKVWIDKNGIARARFGRSRICQALGGVKCSGYRNE